MAMGGGPGGDRRGSLSEINVTPLVDVMLVLLVVFMVTTPIIVDNMKQRKVEVDLPKTSAEPVKAEDLKSLILTLHDDYRITWTDGDDSTPFPGVDCTAVKDGNFEACLAPLAESLRKNQKVQEEQRVYLQADRRLPYGFVVDVMAHIRKAGVPHLGMVTNPPDQPGAPGSAAP
jgi:biopolymer transport protein TolR